MSNFPFAFQNIKNSAIIVQIPLLRETIAQLVYKVKGALAANKCSTAFWVGNLKNKDIYGEEILSQTTSITGSNVSADDENNDDDGEGDEEEENDLLENSNGSEGSGVSKVRRSKRQSNRASTSKGKKRKLYRNRNDMDDDANDNNDNNTSRSRCF